MAQANRHIAPARLPNGSGRLNVVIPAAGIGKRMKSRGPKGLLPIQHGMSILEVQIRTILKTYSHADIVVIGGFEYQKMCNALWGKFPVRMVCNPDYETTNVIHSVKIGINAMLPGPLLIVHGDLVFNTSAISGLAGKESSLLVAGDQLESEEVGIGYQDGFVTTLSYALPSKWGQMAYLRDNELDLFIKSIKSCRLSNQWFLYEALNQVMKEGGRFVAHQPTNSRIVEIDRYSDLMKAKKI